MNKIRLVFFAVAGTYCATVLAEPPMAVEGRDPGVSRWISYEFVGPANSPYPFAYFSTRWFDTGGNEYLAVLSEPKFAAISDFTRRRIDGSDCPGEDPRSNYIWYTVKITMHDAQPVRYCYLPQVVACEFLNSLAELVQRDWTADELRPLTMIQRGACDAVAPQGSRQGATR